MKTQPKGLHYLIIVLVMSVAINTSVNAQSADTRLTPTFETTNADVEVQSNESKNNAVESARAEMENFKWVSPMEQLDRLRYSLLKLKYNSEKLKQENTRGSKAMLEELSIQINDYETRISDLIPIEKQATKNPAAYRAYIINQHTNNQNK